VAFMLVDTRSWYLVDTTLLFGKHANHSPLRSIINRAAETAKGVYSKLGGNYEAPKYVWQIGNGLCMRMLTSGERSIEPNLVRC
jgi:hypothetical protein